MGKLKFTGQRDGDWRVTTWTEEIDSMGYVPPKPVLLHHGEPTTPPPVEDWSTKERHLIDQLMQAGVRLDDAKRIAHANYATPRPPPAPQRPSWSSTLNDDDNSGTIVPLSLSYVWDWLMRLLHLRVTVSFEKPKRKNKAKNDDLTLDALLMLGDDGELVERDAQGRANGSDSDFLPPQPPQPPSWSTMTKFSTVPQQQPPPIASDRIYKSSFLSAPYPPPRDGWK